jgi:hypothetical protein
MNRIILSTTLALAATPFTMRGQDLPDNPNRWSLGPRFGMNFKADFHLRAIASPANPAANPRIAAGGVDHNYQDGYVLVDSSGNAGGLTWNWGYQNGSQVVGDTMQFHSSQSQSSSLPANHGVTGDPQSGLELVYQRVVGNLPFMSSGRWGLEAGFGYTDIDLHDNRSGTGLTTVTTDAFQLNGVLPPGAGYNGTFQGPGTLLGDTPTRTTASYTTAQTSQQRLSGQLYTIRIGPFAEWNFTSKLSLAASVGLTLAPACVDYDFSETTSSSGGTSVTSGHSSKTDLLYGPYVGGTLRYDFTKHWGVYVGVQFQSLTDLQQSIGTHTARLDPGATVYGTIGAMWSF